MTYVCDLYGNPKVCAHENVKAQYFELVFRVCSGSGADIALPNGPFLLKLLYYAYKAALASWA